MICTSRTPGPRGLWAASGEQRTERRALDEPHVQIQPAVDFAATVDGHHMRIVDAGGRSGFAMESSCWNTES